MTPIDHFSTLPIQKINASLYVDLERFNVYKPVSVVKSGDAYVIYNQTRDNIITYIDVVNNEIINGVKRGEAPDEVISPSSFQKRGNDLLLYDIARKIMHKINIENQSVFLTKYDQLMMEERLFVVKSFAGGVLASGIFYNSWITYYDRMGLPVSFLSFPDFEQTRQLTDVEKSSLYISSCMEFSTDSTKIVCATPNAGVISFSKIDSSGIEEYKRIQYAPPHVKAPRTTGSSSIAFERDNIVSFCGLACEDNHVITLYSGRTFNSHGMTSHYCEHVLIYDWDGEPVKHFLLEKPLYSLGFDNENKIIYGIGYDPEGVIIEYDLKSFFECNS